MQNLRSRLPLVGRHAAERNNIPLETVIPWLRWRESGSPKFSFAPAQTYENRVNRID